MKPVRDEGPKPIANLSADQLRSVLTQERLVAEAALTHRMLVVALNGSWKKLAEDLSLPKEFELDRSTGAVFKKGAADG